MEQFDVVIIGGGVCGLSASIEVRRLGKSVLILEKDNYVGGILKQCIHEGFGLIKFRENLTGPEYLEKLIEDSERLGVEIRTKAFVTSIEKSTSFVIKYVDSKGVKTIRSNAVILSTGARERTAKQFFFSVSQMPSHFQCNWCIVLLLHYFPLKYLSARAYDVIYS